MNNKTELPRNRISFSTNEQTDGLLYLPEIETKERCDRDQDAI